MVGELGAVVVVELVVADEVGLVVEQAVEPTAKRARTRMVNRLAIGASWAVWSKSFTPTPSEIAGWVGRTAWTGDLHQGQFLRVDEPGGAESDRGGGPRSISALGHDDAELQTWL